MLPKTRHSVYDFRVVRLLPLCHADVCRRRRRRRAMPLLRERVHVAARYATANTFVDY